MGQDTKWIMGAAGSLIRAISLLLKFNPCSHREAETARDGASAALLAWGCVGVVLGLCWVMSSGLYWVCVGLCWVGLCRVCVGFMLGCVGSVLGWVVFLWVCVQSARSARYVRDYVTGNTLNLLESHCSDPEAPTGNCVTHLFIESRNQRVNIYLDSDA